VALIHARSHPLLALQVDAAISKAQSSKPAGGKKAEAAKASSPSDASNDDILARLEASLLFSQQHIDSVVAALSGAVVESSSSSKKSKAAAAKPTVTPAAPESAVAAPLSVGAQHWSTIAQREKQVRGLLNYDVDCTSQAMILKLLGLVQQALTVRLQSIIERAKRELGELQNATIRSFEKIDQSIATRMAAENQSIDALLLVVKVR